MSALTAFAVAPSTVPNASSPEHELRVLRGARAILQHDPRIRLAVALFQASGRGNPGDVLLGLNRLDAIAIETCKIDIFDLEDADVGAGQVLGIIDQAIARVESRSRTDRVPNGSRAWAHAA